MAIVKASYTRSRGAAKANIRYIQHRPGKTVGKPMTHSTHSHCCELAEISNPERVRYYQTYHSLDCEVYSSEYRLQYYTGGGWPAPHKTRKKAPQKDTVVPTPTASRERNVGAATGKENERHARNLFGSDGLMGRHDAYRMIDSAGEGSVFFRIIISPDPNGEDAQKDLRLWEVTEHTMQKLEERIHKQVAWAASEHTDHTPNRHVHVLAVVAGRLNSQDFQALRQSATEACLMQRQELDLAQTQREHEREEVERERSVG
jgi:hypothetical protein